MMFFKPWVWVILLSLTTSFVTAETLIVGKVVVAAATNLASVTPGIGKAFHRIYPQATVEFTIGASGALATQIETGAPFDLFMSADMDFPGKLTAEGLTSSPPIPYALGTLILLSREPRDFSAGLQILMDPKVTQFALANPETAPYGRAAQQALVAKGLWNQVKNKVVVGQTIAQTLQYTLGATGLGMVHKSALSTKDLTAYVKGKGVTWIDVPSETYTPIVQGLVILKAAMGRPEVQAFARFLQSPEIRNLFVQAGYGLP